MSMMYYETVGVPWINIISIQNQFAAYETCAISSLLKLINFKNIRQKA